MGSWSSGLSRCASTSLRDLGKLWGFSELRCLRPAVWNQRCTPGDKGRGWNLNPVPQGLRNPNQESPCAPASFRMTAPRPNRSQVSSASPHIQWMRQFKSRVDPGSPSLIAGKREPRSFLRELSPSGCLIYWSCMVADSIFIFFFPSSLRQ